MTSYVRKIAFIGIVLAIICSAAYAEVTPWKACPNTEPNAPINCTIHELRVTPCKEGAQSKPCRIKRGLNASIEFDYTTNFQAETLEGRAYWVTQVLDLPFLGMESDACRSTVCPSTPGQKQTYQKVFPISKTYPSRTFDVKWLIESPEGQNCCFIFQIKLHK